MFHPSGTVKEAVKERYSYLRQNEWSEEKILERVSEYEHQIYDTGAYERDRNRWPEGTDLEKGTKLSLFKEFLLNRLNYMDAYIDGI